MRKSQVTIRIRPVATLFLLLAILIASPAFGQQALVTPAQTVQSFLALAKKGDRLLAGDLVTTESKTKTCARLLTGLVGPSGPAYLGMLGLKSMDEYYALNQDQIFGRLLGFILNVKFMRGWETNCTFKDWDFATTETGSKVMFSVEFKTLEGLPDRTTDKLEWPLVMENKRWKIVWQDMPRF